MNNNTYVIGVDGGATKTEAVILAADGSVLGRGFGGPANYQTVGVEAVGDALQTAMTAALAEANLRLDEIAATTWALAGVDRDEDRRRIEGLAARLMPNIPVQIEIDALAALVGGLGTRRGIVLIAGTGMIAFGADGQGTQTRAGGWGSRFDHGSGYALGLAGLDAVVSAADGRKHPTHLTKHILTRLNLQEPADLITWLIDHGSVSNIAALTPLVLDEAAAGDTAALEIALKGAAALADTVRAGAQRLGLADSPFPLVFSGSLLIKNQFYGRLVTQAIQTRLPHANPQLPQAGAAAGAAQIALESLGYPLTATPLLQPEQDVLWASEKRNLTSERLDLGSTLEMVGLMHLADQEAGAAVYPVLPNIAALIEAVADRMQQGGRLIYAGAGTSGRLGVLDASECPPTFNTNPGQVIGLIAGGREALTESLEGAEDQAPAGEGDIAKLNVGPLDSVIGIAASGRTPYVVGVLTEAKQRGTLTAAVTCNLPAAIAKPADYVIAPLVGPEVVTGSTRLKAGTAQKLVLNMISTIVMVRLGKTFGNLMVDVRPSNRKLEARAVRIVAQACEIDEGTAQQALAAANGEVKTAIISHLLNLSPDKARERLAVSGGVIRQVLGET